MPILEDLAQRLIGAGQVAKPTESRTRAFEEIKKGFGEGFGPTAELVRGQELEDIYGHEYATDPYRLTQGRTIATVLKKQDWLDVINDYEDKLKQFSRGVKSITTPGAPGIPTTKRSLIKDKYSKQVTVTLKGMDVNKKVKEGENIGKLIQDNLGATAYQNIINKEDLTRLEKIPVRAGDSVKDVLSQLVGGETTTAPGEAITREAPLTKEERAKLRKEISAIRKKFNTLIPGRSELDALLARYGVAAPKKGVGGAEIQKYWNKMYPEFNSRVKKLVSSLEKLEDVPATEMVTLRSGLNTIGDTMKKKKFVEGDAGTLMDSIFTNIAFLEKGDVDSVVLRWERENVKKINKLEAIEDPIEKDLKRWSLIAKIGQRAESAQENIENEIALLMLQSSFSDAGVDFNSFYGGADKAVLHAKNFRILSRIYLKKMFGGKWKKEAKNKADDYFKKAAIQLGAPKEGLFNIKGNIEAEDVRRKLKSKLDKHTNIMAVVQVDDIKKGNLTEAQKIWLNLYEFIHGISYLEKAFGE